LIQNISRYEKDNNVNFEFDSKMKFELEGANLMDRWIVSANQNLIKYVRQEMDTYKLYNVVRPLLTFLEKLSNWYVRLNRTRMKGEEGPEEQKRSLNILFDVLFNTTTLMACITPFLTEFMYQNLRNGISDADAHLKADSIHFLEMPECHEALLDAAVEQRVARMQSAIENGRLIRDRKAISLKFPLASVTLVDSDPQALKDFEEVKAYIVEELNVLECHTQSNEDEYVTYKCEPDNKQIGSVLKKAYDKKLKAEIASLSSAQLRDYLRDGSLMLGTVKVESGWLKVEKIFNDKWAKSEDAACASNMTSSVLLDIRQDDNLRELGTSRAITNKIQTLRKASGVQIDDQIEVYYSTSAAASGLAGVLTKHSTKVQKAIRMPFLAAAEFKQPGGVALGETSYENPQDASDVLTLYITKQAPQLVDSAVQAAFPSVNIQSLRAYLHSFGQGHLESLVQANGGVLKINLDNTDIELKHKTHFFLSARERAGL